VKDESFDFERIALFFAHQKYEEGSQVIDEKVLNDLDFEDLFISMDRTSSSVGQQYLYAKLRVIPGERDLTIRNEQYIEYLSRNRKLKEDVIIQLHTLNNQGAYFLHRLFTSHQVEQPGWFWLINVLSVSVVSLLLISVFYSPALLFAGLLVTVNLFIHFWNKNNILSYSNIIPQLLTLHKVASWLHEKVIEDKQQQAVGKAIRKLHGIRRFAFFFQWESRSVDPISQVSDYFMDLIKGALLLEPIIFFRLLRQIESKNEEIETLYRAVGEVDMAISLATWRDTLPFFCKPEFADTSGKKWQARKIFHPLIDNPVSNDLALTDQRSVLLSGSNMSGKTTFIRTIGINTLLAQTINIACAERLILSPFRVYSAIRITDDLLDDTSYYYEEVKTIKTLADESRKEQFNLYLLDEIFKGTNTIERVASGKAVLSYLNGPRNLVFCATHDLELIDYLKHEYEYYHFEETIVDGRLVFDYQLKEGSLNNTNAIRILELNGFPVQITEEAKELAGELTKLKKTKNDNRGA
ncbi:MAG: DNA mismatch repair protein MutS, partial [Cyclobacteriaceae bacterium]